MQMKQLLSKGVKLRLGKWNNKRDKMEFLDASKTLKVELRPAHMESFLEKVLQILKDVGTGLAAGSRHENQSAMNRDAHY